MRKVWFTLMALLVPVAVYVVVRVRAGRRP